MKNLLLILMTATILSSCSKDDFASDILGEWEITETNYYYFVRVRVTKLTFKSDGFAFINGRLGEAEVSYTLSGNKFRFDDNFLEDCQVIEYINKDEMKWDFEDYKTTFMRL